MDANTSADAAQVNITGAADEQFSITFSAIDLVGPAPTDLITFTPSLVGAGAVGDKGTATSIVSTDNRNLTASGEYFLWLGGTLTVGATQAPGSYTGDITLTVAYTSL